MNDWFLKYSTNANGYILNEKSICTWIFLPNISGFTGPSGIAPDHAIWGTIPNVGEVT